MQGFHSVNDNISCAAGDGVLCRYAQQLSVATCNMCMANGNHGNAREAAQPAQARCSVQRCRAYHRGAERFALLCVKDDDATVEAFHGELEHLAARLAALRQIEGSVPTMVPTFLSIAAATSVS